MLYGAFLLGLLGSLHCLGMCGPIALLASGNQSKNVISHRFIYNGGRVITYSLLGLIMGLVARIINLGSYQSFLSVGAGIMLILMVLLFSSKLLHLPAPSFISKTITKLKIGIGESIKEVSNVKSLITGLLNGLLPCGLVYVALVGAIATTDPLQAALFMLFFGFGTIPMLLAVTFASGFIRRRYSFNVAKAIPVFVFFMGVLLILRGLNLGIPYVSPILQGSEITKDITDCADL